MMLSNSAGERGAGGAVVSGANTLVDAPACVDSAMSMDDQHWEFSLTLKPTRSESITAMFRRLAVSLNELNAGILLAIVYGRVDAVGPTVQAMRQVFGKIDWPMMWVEGAPCDERPIGGVQIFALGGGRVDRVIVNGRVLGSVFESGGARHCLLGDLGPDWITPSRGDQTQRTFEQLNRALASAGFALGDVVRTWFFMDDLLSWYSDFNAVRSRLYSQTTFRSGSLPASTGVAAQNPAGAALVAGAWAMQPVDASVRAQEVASPLQCPAPAYGSSFSRAVELSLAKGRRLLVSGTASIAPDGTTRWKGDIQGQIHLAMEVVEAILRERGMAMEDTTRATVYLKRATDLPAFVQWRIARRLPSLPFVPVHCDICRSDLLFEIELDAWKAR